MMTIRSEAFCQDNLARDRPVDQTKRGGSDAEKAVDGDMRRTEKYCSRSEPPSALAPYVWWRVMLDQSVSVDLVSVTLPKKEDEYPRGAQVLVTNISNGIYKLVHTCGIITNETIEKQNRATIFISCSPHTRGNLVMIKQSSTDDLVLCEVQVFSFQEGKSNLALAKMAVHHPPGDDSFGADRATDGNSNNELGKSSCSQTKSTSQPVYTYWYVDLGGMYRVNKVEITIPTDSVSTLQDGCIYVTKIRNPKAASGEYNTSEKCSDTAGMLHGETWLFYCSESLVGQFIYVQHTSSYSMGLCEVQVFGDPVTDTSGKPGPTTPHRPATSPTLAPTLSTDHQDLMTYTISRAESTSFKSDNKSITASDFRKAGVTGQYWRNNQLKGHNTPAHMAKDSRLRLSLTC